MREVVKRTGVEVNELVGNTAVLSKLKPGDLASEKYGVPTVTDVLAELDKPGRDPRPTFKTANLTEGWRRLAISRLAWC